MRSLLMSNGIKSIVQKIEDHASDLLWLGLNRPHAFFQVTDDFRLKTMVAGAHAVPREVGVFLQECIYVDGLHIGRPAARMLHHGANN